MARDDPVTAPTRRPRRWLSRWMVGVGIVYVALAVNLGSVVVVPDRVYQFYPTYDAPLDSVAAAVSVDLALMFALEIGVVGAFLLWASRRPDEYFGLVPLILVLEVIRGIVDDVYLLAMRTYTVDAVYYGFIVLHLLVVATGLVVYRGRDGSRHRDRELGPVDGRA